MLDRLPHSIDPVSLADKQRVLQGQLPLSKFTRLADMLLDKNGHVDVDLSFSKEGRLAVVRGKIQANLVLECNACLEAMVLPLNVTVNLAVVKSMEQAERLSGEYEPLMLEEEKIALHEIIEDEMLLVLPDFPRHETQCEPYKHKAKVVELTPNNNQQSRSNNPFSVLAKLKNSGD